MQTTDDAVRRTNAVTPRGVDKVEARLTLAASICDRRNVRFTRYRRSLLRLIYEAERPIGAYVLLVSMASRTGRALTPMTVYRSLDFLLEQGLIARIQSHNTYVAFANPEQTETSIFYICNRCGEMVEHLDEPIDRAVREGGDRIGFRAEQRPIEIIGECFRCAGVFAT